MSAHMVSQLGSDQAMDVLASMSRHQFHLAPSVKQSLLPLLDDSTQVRRQAEVRSLSTKTVLQRVLLSLALGTSTKLLFKRLRSYLEDAIGKNPYRRLALLAGTAALGRILFSARRSSQLSATMAAASALKGGKGEDKSGNGERVCVVGAGIAGCGAAWNLHRSGFDVTLLEKKPTLGGNNKCHTWKVGTHDVKTALGVLAWPRELFHNYCELLKELGVESEPHDLKWFITRRLAGQGPDDVECVYAHGQCQAAREALQQPWIAADLKAWNRLAAFVRRVNLFFQPPPLPGSSSMYRSSLLNPLNLISLRTLSKMFGVSKRFWDEVVVAIHASTFLECDCDTLPAVILEIIEDIVPIGTPDVPIIMDSWSEGNAESVFDRMTEGFRNQVHTSTGVEALRFETDPQSGAEQVIVIDGSGVERRFDKVIFACGAPATLNALPSQRPASASRFLYWLLRKVLSNCKYVECRDLTFARGIVHSDSKRGLPAPFEKDILDDYGTLCETQYDANGAIRYENVFVLSSWIPPMQKPETKDKRPMLVSWNCAKRLQDISDEDYERDITYREAHPCLDQTNMMASMFVYKNLQGICNNTVYFCGSSVTPGNGHDLSLLSGFVVAKKLGADYPFSHNKAASADLHALQDMMGLRA
jgi:predicted NAD/FAD-binding protein